MNVTTKLFGQMDIDDSKIIKIERGIVGFPDLVNFTLITDAEKEKSSIMWLQSLDEPAFALPVMVPNDVLDDYNPTVEDDMLAGLGDLHEGNLYVLNTVSVPSDITKMTMNLKAPFVINSDTLKGAQIIVEDDVKVKFPIYDILKNKKEGGSN